MLSFTWIDVSSEQEQLEVQHRTSEVLHIPGGATAHCACGCDATVSSYI